MEFKFDMEKNKEKIEDFKVFIKENEDKQGALMPVLQKAQGLFGYLPVEVLEIISKGLDIPLSEIYGVVTFYSQFSLIPKGEYRIGVCLGTACYVKGSHELLNKVMEELGIESGQTTPDMKFSLTATRCIGACGLAPVLSVNDDVYGRLKPEDVKGILDKYR
ncbi:complex I 24 kDa subunit family protein [Tissierella praeacuta]|uniref:NAD(P)-dependent iron-only hydrogenase diaphorase component iron-sulfur protein n=1 Tax=Tissierella praeacuta DSM 18095 TaxID=1123404 RepID=A0A1M4TL00_9FIRM|nr:NAD(P)H-dependent oxidoreductase subunit E [Tissierella praeacuta]HAE92577.1 NAD(P)H-dependent oxidoreductase subunit E [Tissierella sp.]MBU5256888.1 NAD(P)H-dependent oxidoreductase subunit E [Tissierella praeacuta]TCU77470.1 NAD(P)-dependent iron-only hydrogenase diaphorase component iron-sulfur protein [Tissierella praeacuta]SHE45075.1 NAD(P)-dependent iron-only hydrogenase diaphorase component iron-sulfur protein [Tissierella praeacuta DSM 18095]SUP04542.1 NADH-quinone oxidoreductase su